MAAKTLRKRGRPRDPQSLSFARTEFNRARRQERGLKVLTQEELAYRLGIEVRQLQRWVEDHGLQLFREAINRWNRIGRKPEGSKSARVIAERKRVLEAERRAIAANPKRKKKTTKKAPE